MAGAPAGGGAAAPAAERGGVPTANVSSNVQTVPGDVKAKLPDGYRLQAVADPEDPNRRRPRTMGNPYVLRGPDGGSVYSETKVQAERVARHLSDNNLNTNLRNVPSSVLFG